MAGNGTADHNARQVHSRARSERTWAKVSGLPIRHFPTTRLFPFRLRSLHARLPVTATASLHTLPLGACFPPRARFLSLPTALDKSRSRESHRAGSGSWGRQSCLRVGFPAKPFESNRKRRSQPIREYFIDPNSRSNYHLHATIQCSTPRGCQSICYPRAGKRTVPNTISTTNERKRRKAGVLSGNNKRRNDLSQKIGFVPNLVPVGKL